MKSQRLMLAVLLPALFSSGCNFVKSILPVGRNSRDRRSAEAETEREIRVKRDLYAKWLERQDSLKEKERVTLIGAKMHNDMGMEAFRKGQYAAAAERFILAANMVPDYVDAINNLGRTYYMMGKFGLAQSALERALATAKVVGQERTALQASIYANIGDVHRQCERYDEAAVMYNKILEIMPNFARAHYELGNLHLKRSQFADAVWRFTKTLELDARFDKAYLGRALAYYHQSNYTAAWTDIMELENRGYEVNKDFRASVLKQLRQRRAETTFRPAD